MLSVGVQTWGTDVPALERYWQAADDLGYACITYGVGFADFPATGMLEAFAAAVVCA